MRAGDMVRFRYSGMLIHDFPNDVPWHLGLLIEYHKWEKVATVMHKGKLLRIRAADVTKAGKKDFNPCS